MLHRIHHLAKRRSHRAPTSTSICPPLKRESKASCFTSPSLPTPKRASTSKVKCASSPSFPQILTATPVESHLEPSTQKKNAIAKEELSMNDIFASSKKGSATFRKILEENGIFTPASHDLSALTSKAPCDGEPTDLFSFQLSEHLSAPHVSSHESEDNSYSSETPSLSSHLSSTSQLHSIVESKFNHLKNSRFYSTSMIFRDRTSKSTSEVHISSSSSKIKDHLPSNSFSSCLPPIHKKETLPHHNSKKILGTSKPLDFSTSEKHLKSSFKTKPTKLRRPTYSPSTTSNENSSSTLLEIVNGEQPLYFTLVVSSFFILLLLYLFTLKLLHRPFDRGKESIVILMF